MAKKKPLSKKGKYDSPWKVALKNFLPQGMELFFPKSYQQIDWSKKPKFLDTNLENIIKDSETGNKIADCLVEVNLIDGQEVYLLLHVEVQGDEDTKFAERMYLYNSAIYSRYRKKVTSFAILADVNPGWQPEHFRYSYLGGETLLRYPTVKLLDYNLEELQASSNPFAPIVEANLKTKVTTNDLNTRLTEKVRIIKGLYQRNFTKDEIIELFHAINWMMDLSDELQLEFSNIWKAYEREMNMPYLMDFEIKARNEGVIIGGLQAKKESIREFLFARFSQELSDEKIEELTQTIEEINDLLVLTDLVKAAGLANSIGDFQQSLEQLTVSGEEIESED